MLARMKNGVQYRVKAKVKVKVKLQKKNVTITLIGLWGLYQTGTPLTG